MSRPGLAKFLLIQSPSTGTVTITSITPNSGFAVGGTAITDLAGTGFAVGCVVLFNGVPATSVVRVSAIKITCVAPAGTAGTAVVMVMNPDGSNSGATGNGIYTYVAAPVVTMCTPATGLSAGGTAITDLEGTGFQNGATVKFNGVDATNVTFVSSTKLTCDTPANPPGVADILVTNPDTQTSGTSGDGLFEYT